MCVADLAVEAFREESVEGVFESFAVTAVLREVAVKAGHIAGGDASRC